MPPEDGHCINPKGCPVSVATREWKEGMDERVVRIETSAQKTHDSTIRQEQIVKGLGMAFDDNKEHHRNMFRRIGVVEVNQASKLSVKDIGQWVIVVIALITLVYSVASSKGQTVREVHYVNEPNHAAVGPVYGPATSRILEGAGRTVHEPIEGNIAHAGEAETDN